MQISLNWLSDYIDLSGIEVAQLAEQLTDLGLEVESVDIVAPVKGELLAGEVTNTEPHPNADSLKVCTVTVGSGDPLTIVCGATNARAGIKVAVAKIGSVLPGNFKIKASKIRGERSEGMMCSERELGLSDEHEGIIELPADIALGTKIAKHFGLEDTILTLGLTPNRADCFGYIGIARDLSARLGRPLKLPTLSKESRSSDISTSNELTIDVKDTELCSRFTALYLKGATVHPSPAWMQRRLEASGMRPINSIVDATNYAMLEWGQPIHAYDKREVSGGVIGVSAAKAGTKFTTLDKDSRDLQDGDILITDANRDIGLAGIMGGENSEVSSDTSEIIIEVACFNPIRIRKTARRLGMHTEASHRFERGVDIEALPFVAERVAELINNSAKEVNGESSLQIAADLVDFYPQKRPEQVIAIRLDRLRKLIGMPVVEQQAVISALTGLGFELQDQKDERMLFSVPSWRHDIFRETDLIEEAIRVIGFNEVPYSLPMMEIRPNTEQPFVRFMETVRVAAASRGFNEIISFPFVSDSDLSAMQIPESHTFRSLATLANPIAADEKYLQPVLAANLLKAAAKNKRNQASTANLFECARGYLKPGTQHSNPSLEVFTKNGCHNTEKAGSDPKRYIERNILGGIITQPQCAKNWNRPEKQADFFELKGLVEQILSDINVDNLEFRPIAIDSYTWMHPGATAEIYRNDVVLGYLGNIHPKTAHHWDFDSDKSPLVFELWLDEIFNLSNQVTKIDTKQFPFPATTRDLAIVVDRSMPYASLSSAMQTFRARNLKGFDLFDVYDGDNVPSDKKSMALALSFQSVKKTLNDKEVDKEIELILAHLGNEISASLRS